MKKAHFETLERAFENLLGNNPYGRFSSYIHDISNTGAISKDQMVNWLLSQLQTKNIPNDLLQEFRIGYIHWLFGKRHFHIDENLAHMLVQTDAHNVESSLLRLPFPCVYFTVPSDLVE